MIDSRELREGNIVRRLVHLPIGYYIPTQPFAEIKEIKSSYVETSMGTDKYSEIGPITLSMDILSRSGGTKHSEKCMIFDTDNPDMPHIYLLYEADKFYLSNEAKDKCSMPIDSLHHFQNLYFDLTGRELKVIL